MSELKTNVEIVKSEVKVSDSNDEANQNRMAVTVARYRGSSPAIFKLHAIACEDLFDYLSLRDLYSIGMTCKRLNRLAGLYFIENFRDIKIQAMDNGIKAWTDGEFMDFSGFSEFFKTIHFRDSKTESIQYVELHCISIEKAFFSLSKKPDFDNYKNIMVKVKHAELYETRSNSEVYDDLLELCKNLKSVRLCSTPPSNNWFLQKYPLLEYVSLNMHDKVDELMIFLDQNPSIRYLKMKLDFLTENEDSLMKTSATLDELSIQFLSADNLNELVAPLLNKLYLRGFYKCLKFELLKFNQNCADLFAKLPAVEQIIFWRIDESVTWPAMLNLKHVGLINSDHLNFEAFVSNAVNLEHVEILLATFDRIQLMMRRLTNLKRIRVNKYRRVNDEIIDISALNKDREKLIGAHNVIIYLEEHEYLSTKWNFGNSEFNLVEIRRIGALPMKANAF